MAAQRKPKPQDDSRDAPEFLDRYAELELDLKAEGDAQGVIKGYASIWDEIDSGSDRVKKGAFAKSLKGRRTNRIPMLYGHNQSGLPIGVWTAIKEDSKGLFVEGKLAMNSEAGRQMFEVLKSGAEMGISIGYRTERRSYVTPDGKRHPDWMSGAVRELEEVDLREVSLVPIPMLDNARITDVKGEGAETPDPQAQADADALIRAFEAKADDLTLNPLTTALDRVTALLTI